MPTLCQEKCHLSAEFSRDISISYKRGINGINIYLPIGSLDVIFIGPLWYTEDVVQC